MKSLSRAWFRTIYLQGYLHKKELVFSSYHLNKKFENYVKYKRMHWIRRSDYYTMIQFTFDYRLPYTI